MQWVERWYISYALLGMCSAGLVPILMPLVVSRTGGAADIGLVMAAFSLGGLTAPFWGGLADRFRLHRRLLTGGLVGAGLGAALFPFSPSLSRQIGLALLSGIGLAAASTVANLFIVEVHPESEWDARIGWLQTFYGSGQVVGLVLAGLIGQHRPEIGFWIAGGIGIFAILPVLTGTHGESGVPLKHRPVLVRTGAPCRVASRFTSAALPPSEHAGHTERSSRLSVHRSVFL